MIEFIQMAEQRQNLLKKKLADREAEMGALRDELEKLGTFIDLGKDLFQGDTPAARSTGDRVHARNTPGPLPETPAPRTMPARQSKPTSNG